MTMKKEKFEPSESLTSTAHVDQKKYEELYQKSISEPVEFWEEVSKRLDWFQKPTKIKNSVYECGMETYKPTWIQFKIQYYIYGLIFLIFDVEIVFLFPFAVAYNKLAMFAVIEAIIFILILLGGYLYIWREDALTWR